METGCCAVEAVTPIETAVGVQSKGIAFDHVF